MKRLAIAVIGALAASVLIYAGAYLYLHYLAYGRTDTCREIARWPRVVKLDVDGTVIGGFGQHGSGPGAFDAVGGVAVDQNGDIYASDFYNHRIQGSIEDDRNY